ncbi:unnamed protein product [Brassicogethes aeneus]|uniref:RING-type E3 ubiquitin transferase n=1 Tax=Brassicogethes aeneus TaxID=1431903 RepID=A0A9P0BC34_BRAAE|nr:unnamed protein product [Brassicogethes aeneus]
MENETMNQFTNDLLKEKLFNCQICDEICTSEILLVKGKGNVCGKCFEEKCGEELKSRAELNTALIFILSKLNLPCKFQSKGCAERIASKKYFKHIARCEFKTKPCPMVNVKSCKWSGNNLEVAEHIQEVHKEDVIKSDNNIFKVEASLTEGFSVKLLSDDYNNCILETSVLDNTFYYALHEVKHSEENMEYSVKHKSIETSNKTVINTVGTLTKLNGIYNEMNLYKNPNATAVDLDALDILADEKDMIINEFNLNPKGVDENILKLLECPVCMNTMRTPIYLCSQGHSVCVLCHEELDECPTCKNKWSNGRNYLIEHHLTDIKYPCRYNKFGCKKIDVENRLNKHEESCVFTVYQCPMGCSKSGNHAAILEHLNSEHADMKYEEESKIEYSENKEEAIKWMMFDLNLFRLSYNFKEDINFAVELVCSQKKKQYKYKITKVVLISKVLWHAYKSAVCFNDRRNWEQFGSYTGPKYFMISITESN